MSEKTMTGRMLISDCLKIYDNDDALLRRYVLQNFEADRAAYWSTCTYHSQKLSAFAYWANDADHDHDVEYLREAARQADAGWAGKEVKFAEYFDSLIPLNERAARDLCEAYAKIGMWRDEDELLMRRLKKENA